MNIEIMQQLLDMAAQAGEGAFWLIIIYIVPSYLNTLLGFGLLFAFIYYLYKFLCSTSQCVGIVKTIRDEQNLGSLGELSEREINAVRNWYKKTGDRSSDG